MAALAGLVKPRDARAGAGGPGLKRSPVRGAVFRWGTRKPTAARAFPDGGRFAWLAGAPTKKRAPDHRAPLAGG